MPSIADLQADIAKERDKQRKAAAKEAADVAARNDEIQKAALEAELAQLRGQEPAPASAPTTTTSGKKAGN